MEPSSRRAWRVGLLAAVLAVMGSSATAQRLSERRGEELVERHCGGCHATGAKGASRLPAAPPLRELYRRYEPDSLAEALAEGILTGHPAMPEFRFEAPDVRAIILYLNAIQDRQTSSRPAPSPRA